jgi:hypothetical protein
MFAFNFRQGLLRAGVIAVLGFGVSGCQMLDSISYEPRSYQVNLGTQNLREELILLNIVRASRYEPLNFTTLSKYTASGSMGATASAQRNIGVDFQLFRNSASAPQSPSLVGSSPLNTISANGALSESNSFDVAPLDNADFYENFLATLTPKHINILVNAGLSRQAVFYSLIDSIDINLSEAGKWRVSQAAKPANVYTKLRYRNDPSNDTWPGLSTKEAFERCRVEAESDNVRAKHGNHWAPFMTDFWIGEHLKDCHYHKFLELVNEAFQYGVTTAAVARTQGASTILASASPQGQASRSSGQEEIILCFDPAIAADYNHAVWPQSSCAKSQEKRGQGGKDARPPLLSQPLVSKLGAFDESMQPVLRSPYGVFQYYGKLLRTATEVQLSPGTERETGDRDRALFKVTGDSGACFVYVGYAGRGYCVPAEEAATTKEVLTLLIALVNLSTVRSSLPYTSSVIQQR